MSERSWPEKLDEHSAIMYGFLNGVEAEREKDYSFVVNLLLENGKAAMNEVLRSRAVPMDEYWEKLRAEEASQSTTGSEPEYSISLTPKKKRGRPRKKRA